MSLPDFELSPTELEELAATEPALAPATARLRVGGESYLLRLCQNNFGDLVLILRLDEIDSPLLKSRYYGNEDKFQRELNEPEKLLNKSNWHRKLKYQVNNCDLDLRVFVDGSQWTYELESEAGQWDFPQQINLSWLARVSDEEIGGRTAELLQDLESDCSFALRWVFLDANEIANVAFCTRKASWEQFVQVMRSIVLYYSGQQTKPETHLKIMVKWRDTVSHLNPFSDPESTLFFLYDKNGGYASIPDAAYLCFELAYSYFRPAYRSNLLRYKAMRNSSPFSYSTYFSVPSHHEILEAQLCLRDFLRDKVSPDELSELMPQ